VGGGPQVLVTRPEPGLGETMQQVAARGFRPVPAPLLSVAPLAPTLPRVFQAILLTSGQAARPLGLLLPARDALVLAVGDRTADHARDAGFVHVESAAGDAVALARHAAARLRPDGGPLLLASGAGQGAVLAAALRAAGFRVWRRAVYRTQPVRALPAPALAALEDGRLTAALFFSGDTARIFATRLPRRLRDRLRTVRAVAISARAAAQLDGLPWKSIEAAVHPDAASLLDRLGRAGP